MVEAAQIPQKELWRLRKGTLPVRILVTDDIADNRNLLRTVLESAGFEVREAQDGIETLEVVGEWKPHAVLLDLRMPRMDGDEAARRLIENPATANIPVIAVTASAFEEDKRIVANAGFAGYVRKPFRPQDIYAILQAKLGLDFELTQPAPRSQKAGATLDRQAMRALDEPTKAELRAALDRGNMTQFKALLARIEPSEPEIAESLSEIVSRYDYDRLHELLGEQ
jgi:CheY-like chemotaxis protein